MYEKNHRPSAAARNYYCWRCAVREQDQITPGRKI